MNDTFSASYPLNTEKDYYVAVAGTGSSHTVISTISTKTQDLKYSIPAGYSTITEN